MNKGRIIFKTYIIYVVTNTVSSILSFYYAFIFLNCYGSEVNGLASTISRLLSFFSVIEGGLNTAFVIGGYKSYLNQDYKKLNDILYTTKKVFEKLALAFFVLGIFGGSLYIFFLSSSIEYFKVFLLLFLCVVETTFSILFLMKHTVLFAIANESRKTVAIDGILQIVLQLVSIMLIIKNANFLIIYALRIVKVLIYVFLLKIKERKMFPFIDYKGDYLPEITKRSNDLFVQKASITISETIDVLLISLSSGLISTSIYSLYYSIYLAISQFIKSFDSSVFNSLGHIKNSESKENIKESFELYKFISEALIILLFSITGCTIVSFIGLYTRNITEANYKDNMMNILIFFVFCFDALSVPYSSLINVSSEFKKQNRIRIISVAINLIVSIVLNLFINVYGVLVGTLCSKTYLFFALRSVCVRNYGIYNESKYKTLAIKLFLSIIFMSCMLSVPCSETYLEWVIKAILISFVLVLLFGLVDYIFSKEKLKKIFMLVMSTIKGGIK